MEYANSGIILLTQQKSPITKGAIFTKRLVSCFPSLTPSTDKRNSFLSSSTLPLVITPGNYSLISHSAVGPITVQYLSSEFRCAHAFLVLEILEYGGSLAFFWSCICKASMFWMEGLRSRWTWRVSNVCRNTCLKELIRFWIGLEMVDSAYWPQQWENEDLDSRLRKPIEHQRLLVILCIFRPS